MGGTRASRTKSVRCRVVGREGSGGTSRGKRRARTVRGGSRSHGNAGDRQSRERLGSLGGARVGVRQGGGHVAPRCRSGTGPSGDGRGAPAPVRDGNEAHARGSRRPGRGAQPVGAGRPRGARRRQAAAVRGRDRPPPPEGRARGGWGGLVRPAALALVAALGSAGPLLRAAETPLEAGDVLTLDEAVSLALQHNRKLAVATLAVERAERTLEASKTRKLPTIEVQAIAGSTLNPVRVTFPGGAFGTYPGIGPVPAVDTVVEAPPTLTGNVSAIVSQPLTQLHQIGLGTKMSELSRDVEQEKLREERAGVVAETRRLYYGLLQTESALRAAEEQVKVFREVDRVVGEQVAQEVALKSDGLEVKAQLASQEYKAASLRNDLLTGKEQLNHLLGRDLAQPFTLEAPRETPPEEVDLAMALARAAQSRPELAQARLAVEQAETDRRLKKAESIPELSLAVSYTSYVNIDLLPRNIAIAGLQLKWKPFDWNRRGKERAEKELGVAQARAGAQDAEGQVRIEVAERHRRLQDARLLVEASRLSREASQEKLRTTTNRYKEQAALLQTLLSAQASASEAQARYDQALMSFWTARADLQKAIGEEQ